MLGDSPPVPRVRGDLFETTELHAGGEGAQLPRRAAENLRRESNSG